MERKFKVGDLVDFDNAYGPPTFQGQRVLTHFYNKGLTYETPEQALILMPPNATPNTSRTITMKSLLNLIDMAVETFKEDPSITYHTTYNRWKELLK